MIHQFGKSHVAKLSGDLKLAHGKYLIPGNRSRWDVYKDISAKLSVRQATGTDKRPPMRSVERAKGPARRSN